MQRDSFVLAIGIDTYSGPHFGPLNNPSRDAKRFSNLLVSRYSFQEVMPPLLNEEATQENIMNALDGLAFRISKEDNLIIYFAGHGGKNPTSDIGFWVPVDDGQKKHQRIQNSFVLDCIEGIDAKHIILISDSCFSGTLLERDRAGNPDLSHDYLDSLKSGWILVSGGIEKVTDGEIGKGSPFNQTICEFLEKNTRESIAAGELFDEVIRITRERTYQSPDAVPIKRANVHKGGQMIFRLPRGLEVADRGAVVSVKPLFALPETSLPAFYIPRNLTYYDPQKPMQSWFYEPEVGEIHLQEVITTQKRVVILGSAGSGKSIELVQLMKTLQEDSENDLIPIYKRFNNYTNEDISAFLPENWSESKDSDLILFLDGLDEIQPKSFSTAIRKLGAFSERHPKIRIVISCRANFYELPDASFSGTLGGYTVYTLNDISLSQIKHFVSTVHKIDGDQFIQAIYDRDYLDLVQKPYFLKILVNYFLEHGNFDLGRAAILEDAMDRYEGANKQQYHTSDIPLKHKELLPLQEKIAYVLERTGTNFINDEKLKSILSHEEYESAKYLSAFRFDGEKDQWQFEHNNIQEYLASRVLSRQSFEEMMSVLSVNTFDEQKIKPNWLNTLSFLISIGENDKIQPLLNWLIENDREIVVRFDPDRILKDTRITLFKDIFRFYSDKQVWLSSNKFSDTDLARFGHFEEVLSFLIEVLKNIESSRIYILNALHVLYRFDLQKFEIYKDDLKNVLLNLIKRPDFINSDIYTVIGVMSHLRIDDKETIQNLVDQFGHRENQYLRAGLYKIIGNSEFLNDYVKIFTNGLRFNGFNYQSEDRDTVTLMDEDIQFKNGLANIQGAAAITQLLSVVTNDINIAHSFFSDHKDTIERILEHVFVAYEEDAALFKLIILLYAQQASDIRKPQINSFLRFFDKHNIRWDVTLYLLNEATLRDYERNSGIGALVNEMVIDNFISQYSEGLFTKEVVEKVYSDFKWRESGNGDYDQILSYFKDRLSNTDITIQNAPEIDRSKSFKEAAQRGFDILFDKEALIAEVNEIFDFFGSDEIIGQDLYSHKYLEFFDLSSKFTSASIDLIRDATYRGSVAHRDNLTSWMNVNDEFTDFRIELIKSRLSALPDLIVSPNQEEYIRNWSQNEARIGNILWYFINRFKIDLPEERLLIFTLYYNQSDEIDIYSKGFIELLEGFVKPVEVNKQVIKNLNDGLLNILAWTANAGYALRNMLTPTFPLILSKLESSNETEYRFADLLRLWFEKTEDTGRLKVFVNSAQSETMKERAIKILMDSGQESDFLVEYFTAILGKETATEEELMDAANRLLKLGVLDGFYFITDYFLKDPKPLFDFRRHFRNINYAKSPDVVPVLMQLLFIAKQPEYKGDPFNDLEGKILDTLYEIGIQSPENFKVVKFAMDQFVLENEGKIQYINFLYFTITKIQDQLSLRLAKELSVEEALEEFESLGKKRDPKSTGTIINIENLNIENKMKIGKVVAQKGSQVNIADVIHKIEFNPNTQTINKEQFDQVKAVLLSLRSEELQTLQQEVEELPVQSQDITIYENLYLKLNSFAVQHGVPIIDGIASTVLFEVLKSIITK